MTDYSRDRLGPDDEDRLPWLEPVEEDYDDAAGGGISRLTIILIAVLVVVALVAGGILWFRNREAGAAGDGALIKAPDSYYKERPDADAGPTAEDEIVYSASKGNEVDSTIDISSAAETPVNVDRAQTAEATPAPAPAAPKPAAPAAARPATPAPTPVVNQPVKQATAPAPKPKPAPLAVAPTPAADVPIRSGGSTVQLGAFSSPAKANTAWKTLSGRFSFLSGLTQSVVPVQSGDKTLYRLRASGGNAGDICKRLRTAGENCSVVG